MSQQAPPTYDGYPLVGIAPDYLRSPFENIAAVADRGPVVTYKLLNRTFTGVYHPEPVETVLVKDASRYQKADLLRESGVEFLENGLFLAEGDTWARQRTVLRPMFYRERIESFADTMVAHADHVVSEWSDGDVVELRAELSRLTLRILAETLLGLDLRNEHEDTIKRLTDTILNVSNPTNAAAYLPTWVPTPTRWRFRGAVREFEGLVDGLLADRRGRGDTDANGAATDVLEMMANAEYEDGSTMDDDTIRDQLMTFLLAGHETSSLALTYTIFYIAQHDDAYDRVAAEARGVGVDGLSASSIHDLDWVEYALKEAMRRRPPVHVIFREPTEPVSLAGYDIPEGRTLTLSPFHVHNDPRWYDSPETYRPGRWTDDLEAALPEYAYFPFGGGPRHCIGMRFAMLEMQIVLATILASVDLELVTDPTDVGFVPSTTLRPDCDIHVRVHE